LRARLPAAERVPARREGRRFDPDQVYQIRPGRYPNDSILGLALVHVSIPPTSFFTSFFRREFFAKSLWVSRPIDESTPKNHAISLKKTG